MNAPTKRTPLPWWLVTEEHGRKVTSPEVHAASDVVCVLEGAKEEDALAIVLAVNSHDDLLAALRDVLAATDHATGVEPAPRWYARYADRFVAARATIAKAEGGTK